jgi:hypothetical protein
MAMSDIEALERPEEAEDTFAVNGEYIAEQAREAMRVFFLPVTSLARAARAKSKAVKRTVRKKNKKAA